MQKFSLNINSIRALRYSIIFIYENTQSLYIDFWDVDAKKLDPQNKPYFIINRLLDKGNIEAVKWVRKIIQKVKSRKHSHT